MTYMYIYGLVSVRWWLLNTGNKNINTGFVWVKNWDFENWSLNRGWLLNTEPLYTSLTVILKFIPCKRIWQSVFWTPPCGFWILDILDSRLSQWKLDPRFKSLMGIQIPWAVFQIPKPRIPDSTSKMFLDSRFCNQKFLGFWNPYSLSWGDNLIPLFLFQRDNYLKLLRLNQNWIHLIRLN